MYIYIYIIHTYVASPPQAFPSGGSLTSRAAPTPGPSVEVPAGPRNRRIPEAPPEMRPASVCVCGGRERERVCVDVNVDTLPSTLSVSTTRVDAPWRANPERRPACSDQQNN